jgi:flagellin
MPVTTSNHHHNSKEGVHMIINTNTGASTAARILASNTDALQKSLKRLSTGNKIASVSDDAAGIAVGSKLTGEISRLSASKQNVSNLISFAQTQDGYLEQIEKALKRMGELAMLATDDTKNDLDLDIYDEEFQSLEAFVDSMANKEFNGISLFNGTAMTAYIGVTQGGADITVGTSGISLGATSGVMASIGDNDVQSHGNADDALEDVLAAQKALAALRSKTGMNLSRLEQESASLSILRDNIGAARSRILDVDVAEESANFAKQQILVQSGTAMLAQANILPQSALRLIS